MRILIATDAFPPTAGGSGWSTYELARGLRARGHHIVVVQPYAGRRPAGYDGFEVMGVAAPAPPVPFVRNYFRNERLYRRLARHLAATAEREQIDLIHAQHELTIPAGVRAGKLAHVPSVGTIRDYWPLCYWSDLVRSPIAGDLCPGCSAGAMTRCLPPRVGPLWPATLPMIPYMRSNLATKQRDLARADAVVAVSQHVAVRLRERAPALSNIRLEVIPNAVDVHDMRRQARTSARPLGEPYALFVGKLARNKGVSALVEVVATAKLALPLVVIGDGPERGALTEAAGRGAGDLRVLPWMERQDLFRWLAHAAFLIFPSNWPEPLSRVLLEASALGVPVAAINTGGTPDVIADEETGLLSSSVAELSADVARLATDASLRERLGRAAAARADSRFDVAVVIPKMEDLYRDVMARHRAEGAR